MAVYKEEKTNTWRVIYRYTDWTGEREQSQKRGFKTKREALAWEREQLNKATADLDMTFASFVEQYTADMKTRIKEDTWATKDHIILEAPAWKQYIDATVSDKVTAIISGVVTHKSKDIPLVPAGAVVHHAAFGDGQVVALKATFPNCHTKTFEVPYLHSLPDEISFCADGKTLLHDRFGEGTVFAYVVVFKNHMMALSYPAAFEAGCLVIE